MWEKTIDIEGKVIPAVSAAAQKLSYLTLKAKQIDVVMGIVSKHDVFTTLNMRYGKLCYIRLPYKVLFIFSLSQVRGIASLQPRHNGDSVATAAHVYYFNPFAGACN